MSLVSHAGIRSVQKGRNSVALCDDDACGFAFVDNRVGMGSTGV